MGERISRYEELIIWIMPLPQQAYEEQRVEMQRIPSDISDLKEFPKRLWKSISQLYAAAAPKETQTYDAWIYTDVDIPGLDESLQLTAPGYPEIHNLKFAKRGQLAIHWEYYGEYLAAVSNTEQGVYKRFWRYPPSADQRESTISAVRDRMFELFSPGLQALFCGQLELTDRPLRVWLNCTPPELAEFPWELLGCELRKKKKTKFSFVRGLPPVKPLPKISVVGKLRLALVHDPQRTPDAIKSLVYTLKDTLDITEMTESPLDALKLAAKEGFELVHLITDGALSVGHEGVLHLRKSLAADSKPEDLTELERRMYEILLQNVSYARLLFNNKRLLEWNDRLASKLSIETCSVSELSAILHGSRVTLLSLSTPKTDNTDLAQHDGTLLPAVYRAFANIGISTLTLPNIVAPLGNCDDGVLQKFWRCFYTRLTDSRCYSIEEATAYSLQEAPASLMAVFMRQRLGREFTRRTVRIAGTSEDATRANTRLEVGRSLIDQLRAIDANYKDIDAQFSETPLVKDEAGRQSRLEADISPLTRLEDEEL